MTCCPVPDCTGTPPPRCVFCPECYFKLSPAYARAIHRVQFECERALDDDRRKYLAGQLRGYISVAVRSIQSPLPGEGGVRAA